MRITRSSVIAVLLLAVTACGSATKRQSQQQISSDASRSDTCQDEACQSLALYLEQQTLLSGVAADLKALELIEAEKQHQAERQESEAESPLPRGEDDFLVCGTAYLSFVTAITENRCHSITFREKITVIYKVRGYTADAGLGLTIVIYKRFFDENRHQQVYGNLDANADFPPSLEDFRRISDPDTIKDILTGSQAIGLGINLLFNTQLIKAHHRRYGKLIAGSRKFGLGIPVSLTEMLITIREINDDEQDDDRDDEKLPIPEPEDDRVESQIPHQDLIQVGAFTVLSNADNLIKRQKLLGNYCRKFPFVRNDGVFFNRVKCVRPL